MSTPLPSALRARFQRYIEDGLSGRAAALRLKLSPATYIQPSKPQQNAYVERYNRTVRLEWPTLHL